ncbi:MAG: LptA/OstA family protein [Hyphomicrobium sp.]
MAITTDLDHGSDSSRATGSGIVTGHDRTKSIGEARRHTFKVRVLRVALPAASLALIGFYASAVMRTAGVGASLPQVSIPRIIPEQLTMANPHYEGFGKDGSTYVLDSQTAKQDPTKPGTIILNGITGTLVQIDKTKTLFSAASGNYNSKSSILELYDRIDVKSENGFNAQLTRATLTAKESVLVSKVPVAVQFTGGSVNANSMTLRHKAHEVTFVDNVVARMVPQKPDAAKQGAESVPPASNGPQMFEATDAPIDITSSRLDVKDTKKTAVFTGSVIAKQNDQSLLTPELTVTYDDTAAAPAGTQAATAKPEGPASSPTGKIQRILAKGPVIMERGALERVTADSMDFNAPAQSGALIGNVVMISGEDRQATSDRADLDQKASTVLLSGNVVIVQGQNEMRGGRLFIDRQAGHALLTTPPVGTTGAGRITARLVRGDGAEKPNAKPNKKKPAPTAATTAGGESTASVGSFKTDPNAPIDIDANQLEVNDTQKAAVFRGDVKAVQGEFVIKTPELVANYTGDMKMADVTTTEPAKVPDANKPSTELTHIRANTKVNVTSADGQSVDGDWADYDAKAGTIVVGGEVVLSKGGSMVRGTRLLIDTVSGESTIETAPGQAVALPGGGGWATTAPAEAGAANRGRPSAVFFPSEMQKKDAGGKKEADKPAKPSAPASAGTPWQAETSATPGPADAEQTDN